MVLNIFFLSSIPPLYLGIWLLVLIISLFTLSKRKDMYMPIKVFWALVIFFAPVIGLIFYIMFSSKTSNKQRP